MVNKFFDFAPKKNIEPFKDSGKKIVDSSFNFMKGAVAVGAGLVGLGIGVSVFSDAIN